MADSQEFYLKCAKELALKLKNFRDRALASAWIIRLETDKRTSQDVTSVYAKILVYVLQRGSIGGPFSEHPNNFDLLPEIPENQNLFLATSFKKRGSSKRKAEEFFTDFSGDLLGTNPGGIIDGLAATEQNSKSGESSKEGNEDVELEQRKAAMAGNLRRKAKTDKKVLFSVTPIGKETNDEEDRPPPTWGSNMISVNGLEEDN